MNLPSWSYGSSATSMQLTKIGSPLTLPILRCRCKHSFPANAGSAISVEERGVPKVNGFADIQRQTIAYGSSASASHPPQAEPSAKKGLWDAITCRTLMKMPSLRTIGSEFHSIYCIIFNRIYNIIYNIYQYILIYMYIYVYVYICGMPGPRLHVVVPRNSRLLETMLKSTGYTPRFGV